MKGAGTPVWDDLASPEDVAALDPGPGELDANPDVLVVGGGAVGLAIAAFCERAGMRALVVERGRLAGGASGRAAGGLSPDAHPELGESWQALARQSLALHRALDAEWDYGLRTRDVLVPPDLLINDQAHVDPVRFAAALARRAGTIATSTQSTYTLTSGGRVVTVVTSGGLVRPDAVVFATGTAPPHTPSVRQTLVKGHLIATEAAGFELGELVTDGETLVVQVAERRLVAGGTKDRDDQTEAVDEQVVGRIERRMRELVPEAAGLARTHAWTCFRPCCSDELPIIDRVPGLRNAWFASGLYSTGILMAPIVGQIVSEWIASGRHDVASTFGLDRLR